MLTSEKRMPVYRPQRSASRATGLRTPFSMPLCQRGRTSAGGWIRRRLGMEPPTPVL